MMLETVAAFFLRELLQRRRKGKTQHHTGTQPATRASRTPGTTAQATETQGRPSGARQGQAPKKAKQPPNRTEQETDARKEGEARTPSTKPKPPRERKTPQAHTHISAQCPRTKILQTEPRVPSRPGNTGSSYPTATPAC